MMIKKWERKWNRQAENHIFTLLCDITENLRLVSTVRKMMIIIRDQRPRTLLDKIAKFSSVCDFYHDNSSKSLVRFRLCDSAWAKTQQATTLLMFSFVMDIFLVSFKFKHSEFIFEYWKLTSVTVSDDDAGKARKLSRIENCSISRWQQERERDEKGTLWWFYAAYNDTFMGSKISLKFLLPLFACQKHLPLRFFMAVQLTCVDIQSSLSFDSNFFITFTECRSIIYDRQPQQPAIGRSTIKKNRACKFLFFLCWINRTRFIISSHQLYE